MLPWLKHITFTITAYCEGIWFLIAHPLRFVQFVKVYKGFQKDLDDTQQVAESGYYHLSRAERRAAARAAKKRGLV